MTNQPFQLPAVEPRRDGLPESRLSRLPKLGDRPKFELPKAARCKNCEKVLDRNDDYQIAVGFCKACLRTYAVVGIGIEKYTESKIRRNFKGGKQQ